MGNGYKQKRQITIIFNELHDRAKWLCIFTAFQIVFDVLIIGILLRMANVIN